MFNLREDKHPGSSHSQNHKESVIFPWCRVIFDVKIIIILHIELPDSPNYRTGETHQDLNYKDQYDLFVSALLNA